MFDVSDFLLFGFGNFIFLEKHKLMNIIYIYLFISMVMFGGDLIGEVFVWDSLVSLARVCWKGLLTYSGGFLLS